MKLDNKQKGGVSLRDGISVLINLKQIWFTTRDGKMWPFKEILFNRKDNNAN